MSIKSCPKCKTIFKYPSVLKAHMKNAFHCLTSDEEIEIYFNTHKQPKKIIECSYCKISFSRNTDLTRHNLKSKCGKIQEAKHIELTSGISKLTLEQIKLLYPNQAVELLEDIAIQQNITNNNITNNNNIINNNITINNITLPQIIYPFGSEDISFLNDSEMLEILKSPNGAIIAMEKVYAKLENRNFYKQNIGKDNISYLDSNLEIQIYKQKDFQDKLLYQSVEFMYRICFKCRDRLTLEDQFIIMKNINIIEKTLEMKNDVANLVSVMLERDFMNVSRREFIQKFNTRLQIDKTFKDDKVKFLKEIKRELYSYYVNKTHTNINDNLLKNEAWTKSEDDEPDVKKDEVYNNLNMYYINDTPRYKFFKEMKEDELEYLKYHGFTIGDIRELIKIHSERSKQELLHIEENYEKERIDNIKDTLKHLEEQEIINGLDNINLFRNRLGY